MLRRLSTLAAAALIATASHAQEGQQAQEGEEDLKRTPFGEWTKVCAADESACVLEQLGKMENGESVLLLSIQKLPEPRETNGVTSEAVVTVRTPQGVLLGAGVGIKVDSGEPVRLDFLTCVQDFCLVQAPASPELVASFRAGAVALVAYNLIQNNQVQEVVAPVSLSGFTRGYNSL